MKRQIRRGVFETNSSSQHSLCIMKKDEHYTPDEISKDFYLWDDKETGEKDCEWHIWDHDMEFGRSPFRALGNFHDKWLYACASLVHEYNDENYKKLEALALKYVPGLKKIIIPMISDSVADKNHPENKDSDYAERYGKTEDELNEWLEQKEKDWKIDTIEYWEGDNGYFHFEKPYTGYVDENMLSGFLKKENISLEEYLTNKKYVVIQDGDEYCYWSDMKKAGLVNMDAIDHEYPRAFETNSSSVHSLTMCTSSDYDKWKNGELVWSRWDDELIPITEEIKRSMDNDEREFLTYDQFDDYDYMEYKTYSESFTTPSGETVYGFGYYGHD